MGIAEPSARRPAWAWVFFFAPPPSGVTPHEWRLLGLLGLTFLLNQYDMALLGLALPQIQEGLGIEESDLGGLMALVRIGGGTAVLLAYAADYAGRRRLLLVTIAGFAICTVLTAFARSGLEFALLQLCARAFITAEEVVAIVVVAEELAARSRGWGLGILAAFGALGHGLASLAFGFVEQIPTGWRALYAAGGAPLLGVAWLRRGLRETRRFEAERLAHPASRTPLRDLVSLQPRRLLTLLAAVGAFGFVVSPALGFVSKTLQEVHGFSPPQVTMLFLGGGSLAIVGNGAAGLLADRFGRRPVLAGALVLNAGGIAAFYGASGPAVVSAWIAMMFTFVGCDVLFGALGSELFPTSHRSTASGLRMAALAGGGALGLAAEGWLFDALGSHRAAVLSLLAGAAIAPLAVAFALPETARRELEEIAPGRPSPPSPARSTPDRPFPGATPCDTAE